VFSAVHHYLPHVVQAFRERHPGVLVRIVEEGADEVLTSVKQGEADFAVNYIGMQDEELEFTLLMKEPYVLACPAGHPLSRRRCVNWEELAPYPQARVSHASRNRLFIDQALAELPPLPRPIIEVRHVSTLIGFVEAGLAVAVVPKLCLPLLSRSVVGVRLEQPAISRPLAIVRRRNRTLSPAAEAFSRMLERASPLNQKADRQAARRHPA
jgi:DNA-binding transcriptional LysR family regulator